MPDDPRHARVGDHAGRQHRVGGREQRADEQARRPAEADDPVRGAGHDQRGQRHRHRELAQRQPPRLLEHLALDLEPVAEQDHDQRHEREVVHERPTAGRGAGRRSRPRRAGSRRPRTPRSARGTSDGRGRTPARPPSAARRGSAVATSKSATATRLTRGRVPQQEEGQRARADHRAGEVPRLAGRRRRLLGLSRRGRRRARAARLRPRRVRQAAPLRRLRGDRRGGDQPPARRPHPRPGAVRLRAALRAARGAATQAPPARAARRARGAGEPVDRRGDAGRAHRGRVRPDDLRPGRHAHARRAHRPLPPRPALHPLQRRRVRATTAPASRSPPTARPTTRSRELAHGHRPAADRGHAAGARAPTASAAT